MRSGRQPCPGSARSAPKCCTALSTLLPASGSHWLMLPSCKRMLAEASFLASQPPRGLSLEPTHLAPLRTTVRYSTLINGNMTSRKPASSDLATAHRESRSIYRPNYITAPCPARSLGLPKTVTRRGFAAPYETQRIRGRLAAFARHSLTLSEPAFLLVTESYPTRPAGPSTDFRFIIIEPTNGVRTHACFHSSSTSSTTSLLDLSSPS